MTKNTNYDKTLAIPIENVELVKQSSIKCSSKILSLPPFFDKKTSYVVEEDLQSLV